MFNIYKRAYKECGYKASIFLNMLYKDKDAIKTARNLICKAGGTEGFLALVKHNRPDLSIEDLVLRSEYNELFTEDERNMARQRLLDYGFPQYRKQEQTE